MAKKTFSNESRQQQIIDAAWGKYQKANAKKKTVKKPTAKKK